LQLLSIGFLFFRADELVDFRHPSVFERIENFKKTALLVWIKPFMKPIRILHDTTGADIKANGKQGFFEPGAFFGILLEQPGLGGKFAKRFEHIRRGTLFQHAADELNGLLQLKRIISSHLIEMVDMPFEKIIKNIDFTLLGLPISLDHFDQRNIVYEIDIFAGNSERL
jgi:hypothetical protein